MLETLFRKEINGTIVSLTTVVQQYSNKHLGFTIITKVDEGTELKLIHRDSIKNITFSTTLVNGLWFHEYSPHNTGRAKINRLNDACLSNLWHTRVAHAGRDVVDTIHRHIIGIDKPLSHNTLYKYRSCLPNKLSKTPHKRVSRRITKTTIQREMSSPDTTKLAEDDPFNEDILYFSNVVPCQNFHISF